ncbi:ABC transporter ATP-binding protein [Oceanithermus desulfurans]|uniref:ABC transporter ATP-binding protein n=2 Tax=Oceanithermus desulfurans TaxID=227924 RepID=A0A511RL91_9DEIN|nr:ABC transporter ATP-binding protein [Oceanithermus desulfurans]MBB6029866.1 putative spermidine/putrescine transport system ATP-binding protein [Oceanithermus desulfurans]GEM89827.1 ABC transporter ATP-binding protein [Oceanithermus desulfurans NBRC 100063]
MLAWRDVVVRYPGFELRLDLEVARGETLALLGPSGSGKSSALRVAAGLERPAAGRVFFGERDVTDLPPERRGVGFVFQDYALFPHLTVERNVTFGLEERGWERDRIRRRVGELLAKMGLEAHARKKPEQLSGGERQRVALARALAPEPAVLLLDEPLGALDLRLRERLLLELRRVLSDEKVTAVFVTHDQTEAFVTAGRVAIVKDGRLVQQGAPEQVFERPADAWTARFLGHKNVLEPRQAARLGLAERWTVLLPGALGLGAGPLEARVRERLFYGPRVGVWLEARGVRLYWEGPEAGAPPEGARVRLTIDPARAVEVRP